MSDSIGNRKELPEPTEPNDLVRRAVLQLRVYAGDVDQDGARGALPHWRHFAELTAGEMLTVVEAFPAEKPAPRDLVDGGTHWHDTGSGPGYVS